MISALNGLGYFSVAAISLFSCYSLHRMGPDDCKVGKIMGILGVFFFLMSFMGLFLGHSESDFMFANAVLTVITSVLLAYAIFRITGNKNMLYLLVLFMTSAFAINFSLKSFFTGTLAASGALVAIISANLAFFSNFYLKKAGYAGLLYAIISVAIIFAGLGKEQSSLPWFLQSLALFFMILFLHLDVRHLGIIKMHSGKSSRDEGFLPYSQALGKFLVFIVTMSAFIFISTIAVHELGHALTAQYYGCQQFKAVIYDIAGPHTEISCSEAYNNMAVTLAGLAATFAIGLIFITTGGRLTRDVSYLMFGFGILISYADILDLGVSKNLVTLLMLMGLIITTLAVVSLSIFYLEQQKLFSSSEKAAEGHPSKRKRFKHAESKAGDGRHD